MSAEKCRQESDNPTRFLVLVLFEFVVKGDSKAN